MPLLPSARRVRALAPAAVLACAMTAGTLACTTGSGPEPAAAAVPAPLPPGGAADYQFLSAPDFLNMDVGDLRHMASYRELRKRVERRGDTLPNSWNRYYADMLRTILDKFAAEQPDDVLVAGDLVEGEWGVDLRGTRIFGPVRTEEQQVAAVRKAGRFYYGEWIRRFRQRDLTVHAAVGDHEIGDGPWRGADYPNFKRRHLELFKSTFARSIIEPQGYTDRPRGQARDTAYAVRLHPEVLLVTVDVWSRTGDGDVSAHLDRDQLTWLDRTLDRAQSDGVDWIVVQGHTPVLGPVRTWGSSAMSYDGGERSAFWRTMVEHQVDLYLNGEVHDVTAIQRDGVTQISHGGIIQARTSTGRGGTSYLVARVHGDRMWLEVKRWRPEWYDRKASMWQTYTSTPAAKKIIEPEPEVIGTMVLTSDQQVLHRDGYLGVYEP